MPITVSCPQCSKALNAPDNLVGKRVRCPDCSTPFVLSPPDNAFSAMAPAARETPPPPADEFSGMDAGGDQPYTQAALKTGWTQFGLGLQIIAITTMIAGGIFGLFLLLAMLRSMPMWFVKVMPYVIYLSAAAGAAGMWFCAQVPKQSGEQSSMLVGFLFQGGGAALLWFGQFMIWVEGFGSVSLAMMAVIGRMASVFALPAGWILFLFGLRGIIKTFRSPFLASSIFGYIVFFLAAPSGYMLFNSLIIPFAEARVRSSGPYGGGPSFFGLEDVIIAQTYFTFIMLLLILAANVLWLSHILLALRSLVLRAPQLRE
jgi:hypothetical protein